MKIKILKNKRSVAVALILGIILIVKVLITLSYKNVEWEPDAYMHFLQVKTVFTNFPDNIGIGMSAWAKPLYIYPLGLFVQLFGVKEFFFVEVINILIFILIAFLVYKIVLKLYGNFYIAVFSLIAVSFSLTLFKTSTSTLTESVFTLFLIVSFYYITLKKYYLGGLFVGLSVLGRIEGLFFIGLYLIFVLLINLKNRKELIITALITLIPLFAWNFLGFLSSGNIFYIRTFFQSYSINDYGKGNLLDYPRLFITKEFLITLIFVLSVFALSKIYKKLHYKKEVLYSALIASTFILVQIVFWSLGLFGTAGLMRYFVCVIPFMIIFDCAFLSVFQNYFSKSMFKIFIMAIAVIQIALTFSYLNGFLVRTKEFPMVEQSYIDAGIWIKTNIKLSEFLAADRPEVIYYSGRDLTNSRTDFNKEFHEGKSGIYVWTEWSIGANNITKAEIEQKSVLLKSFDDKVFIYKLLSF